MPSSPRPSALQPTTCRPAGPLRIGSRRLRQPTTSSISGTSQPTLPTEPVTATRTAPMTGPPSWNQTAAAQMTDSAKMKRPTPSRRCSGSRSRAPWPMPAGDRADAVGDGEPDGGDAPEDGVEEPGDRSPAGADRAGCRAPVAAGRTRSRRGARPASASASSSCSTRFCSASGYSALASSRTAPKIRPCFANPAGKTYGSPRQHPRQSSHQSQGPQGCVSCRASQVRCPHPADWLTRSTIGGAWLPRPTWRRTVRARRAVEERTTASTTTGITTSTATRRTDAVATTAREGSGRQPGPLLFRSGPKVLINQGFTGGWSGA